MALLLLPVNWDAVVRWWERRRGKHATSPETELWVATAAGPMDARKSQRVHQLVAAAIDWKLFLEKAQLHGVLQFVASNLGAAGIAIPEPWGGIAQRQSERNAAHALFQYREWQRISDAFAREGIAAVPLKGTALSLLLYGKVTLRTSSDIDLLIPSTALPEMRKAMASLEYEVVDPHYMLPDDVLLSSGKDVPYVNRATRSIAEIHWRVFTPDRACGLDTSYEVLKRNETGLTPQETLLILVHHGLQHHWEVLKWIVDIDAFVRNVPLDWDALMMRARATGSVRPVSIALLLAHRLFGTPLPCPIDRTGADRLTDRCIDALLHGRRISLAEDFRLQLLARERWIDRLRFVRMVTRLKPRDHVHGRLAPFGRALRLLRQSTTSESPPLAEIQKITEFEQRQ